MNLLLIRHATARALELPDGDFVRHLGEKGREQGRRVGRFLKKHELIPDIVLTSPVIRAKETAKFLAEEGCPKPIIKPWLECGMRPEQALEELKAYQEFSRVAIVGHEPDFSALVENIIGATSYSIKVKKTSLISIELGRNPQLHFSIPCKFLR